MPEEKENFQKNAESYISQLKELDNEFRTIVENAKINEIIFADKFPLQYFAKEYGLSIMQLFRDVEVIWSLVPKLLRSLWTRLRKTILRCILFGIKQSYCGGRN